MSTVAIKATEREFTDVQAFANAVRKRRKELGKTQLEMAEQLGIKQPSYFSYESGSFMPEMETVFRLEAALELPPLSLCAMCHGPLNDQGLSKVPAVFRSLSRWFVGTKKN